MSSLKASYEEWVRKEQKWLLPLLDTARNLTLFLPGRFSDTELRSEASQPRTLRCREEDHSGRRPTHRPVADAALPVLVVAVYTALNLLTVYHDYILDRSCPLPSAVQPPSAPPPLTSSPFLLFRARAVTCELKCGPRQPHPTHIPHTPSASPILPALCAALTPPPPPSPQRLPWCISCRTC